MITLTFHHMTEFNLKFLQNEYWNYSNANKNTHRSTYHTLTLILSEELWHSLKDKKNYNQNHAEFHYIYLKFLHRLWTAGKLKNDLLQRYATWIILKRKREML